VHNKIEDFTSKLDRLRSALILGSILAFRASANSNTKEVLGHLRGLEHKNQNQGADNAELIQTIQTLVELVHDQTAPKLDSIHEQIQDCLKRFTSLRDELSQTQEKKVLRWLDFRQLTWRFEEVPLAYQKTFQWIFEKSNNSTAHSWDDFAAHFSQQEVTSPYFINGKAGSGKSTLMKFIVGNPKTKKALAQWAENRELMIVKYFFWDLGTDLQKTSTGMQHAKSAHTRYIRAISRIDSRRFFKDVLELGGYWSGSR